MRLSPDLFARLKAARHHGTRTSNSDRLLRQWVLILCVGLLVMVMASVYAVWRFEYWSQIEKNVAKEEVSPEFYNRSTIEEILREFDEKASTTDALLNEYKPESAATTSEAVME